MLKDLNLARRVISMEAASGGAAADKAAARIPAFLEKATDFFTRQIAQPIKDFFSRQDLGWVAANINRRSYTEMRGIELIAPVGFQGNFADYAKRQADAVEKLSTLCEKVLVPYARWVGEKLGDPSSLASLTNSLKIPGMQMLDVEKMERELNAFFPDRHRETSVVYGDVIARQSDWTDINHAVKRIEAVYNGKSYEQTVEKIDETIELLNKLAQRMGEFKQEYKLSSVTTEQLAKVTFEIAQSLEFFGVTRHRVEEFLKTVQTNVEIVKAKF